MKKHWLHGIGGCLYAAASLSLIWAVSTQAYDVAPTLLPVDAANAATPSLAQRLPTEVQQAWRATKLPDAALSLVVQEVDGTPVLAVAAATPRNPASVMKLVTTWAALSVLGPQHVWRTELLTDPGARPDGGGALAAPLYLRASGDPWLRIEDVWALLHALRLRGVRRIGDVVVDRSVFGAVAIDPGAFDGAAARAYNASPDALVVGFGAVRLVFVPDAQAQRWTTLLDPPVPGVTVTGGLQWQDGRCAGIPLVTTSLAAQGQGVTLHVEGQVAGACGEFSRYRLALEQSRFAAAVLHYLWQQLGGEMTGTVRAGPVPADAVVLSAHESPALTDVIRAVNKESNNLMARLLLLSVGAQAHATPATLAASREAALAALAAQGLTLPELVLDNGAGLSRTGRVAASSLARVLTTAWASPLMPDYVSSLAIAGVDGTLRKRLENGPARGRAHLKTGSLRDVRAIAGYVHGASGKRYVVVSLVNHENAHTAQAFEDALIEWLAQR